MIKQLRKIFSAQADNAAQAETVKEEVMSDVVATPEGATDLAKMSAIVTALTAKFEASEGRVAELTAALTALADVKAAADKLAADTKFAARKVKVEAAIGTEKAVTLLAAVGHAEDSVFDAVMAAMSTSAVAEAATLLFKEVGVDGKVDPAKLAADTANGTMAYLQAQYPKAKAK